MKRRGSVRGRADAGTGSGPGVERVITAFPHSIASTKLWKMLPLLSFGAGADAETGGALGEWFMLVVGKKVVHNGEGTLNDGPTDNVHSRKRRI